MESRSKSFENRPRSAADSWVEVASHPSSSSVSSAADDIVTTGLRVQAELRAGRRPIGRPILHTHLRITRTHSVGETSSQEEYEESESESDRIMASSSESPTMPAHYPTPRLVTAPRQSRPSSYLKQTPEDDDEERTATNYPIDHPSSSSHKNKNNDNNDTDDATCFTPQPNAFSRPASAYAQGANQQPTTEAYLPTSQPSTSRPHTRRSLSSMTERRRWTHIPQNPLSPSFNATAEHDEALRASLTGLLSVAAAARGLSKTDTRKSAQAQVLPRANRMDPLSFRLVPESALPNTSQTQLHEPTFKPTIRRTSTSSTSTISEWRNEHKRKASNIPARNFSRERTALKKTRRSASTEDLNITPTLLTWVVSAGVVVLLSALSFGAGYSMGKEVGRMETATLAADERVTTCAREATRSSLGLKRSLARTAIQA